MDSTNGKGPQEFRGHRVVDMAGSQHVGDHTRGEANKGED